MTNEAQGSAWQLSFALNNLVVLYWYLGHADRARCFFQRVEEVTSERLMARRPLSFWDLYARLVLGRYEEALADLQQAVAQTPEVRHYESVLNVLHFLHRAALQRLEGLDEFIETIGRRLSGRVWP